MLTFRDFITGFRKLEIDRAHPVIVHASLSALGEVHGGVETVLGALCSSFDSVVMPTFTYKTMITPEVGPTNNAMIYGSGKDTNRMAEIFHQDMPADPLMGILAEKVRLHPRSYRSSHPILSFAGINAQKFLASQTIKEPLLPIQNLKGAQGWVILIGVNQKVNTSIHYGEYYAGRKQFIRWALTPKGVIPCQGFPGCSEGFEGITPNLDGVCRRIELGGGLIQAIPLTDLVDIVCGMLTDDPLALLCNREDCERCNAVRESVKQKQ